MCGQSFSLESRLEGMISRDSFSFQDVSVSNFQVLRGYMTVFGAFSHSFQEDVSLRNGGVLDNPLCLKNM